MQFINTVILSLTLVSMVVVPISSYQYNASCSLHVECIPRETYMRCTKTRCLCAADAEYDFRNSFCRLKINVKCSRTGNNIQPCVKGAFCDPPTFADGQKIEGASTGNCKCYKGESNEEDGTCSSANSWQRSFGHSSNIISTTFNTAIIVVSLCATGVGFVF